MIQASLRGVCVATRFAVVPFLGVLWACSAPVRGPFYGDEKLLRIGVDPLAEAAEVQSSFERAGHRVAHRLPGKHFIALSFRGPDGRPSAVRVVTARGIALALDAESANALTPGTEYGLLPRPLDTGHDADGDGFDELFVVQVRAGRSCVLPYRVRDVGFVDALELDLAWLSSDPCIERVADRDGDGRIELLAPWTITDLPLSIQPEVTVALFPEHHDYTPVARPDYYGEAISILELELAEAQRAEDAERVYSIGVKLAALLALSGFGSEDQLAWLRAAIAGIPGGLRDPAVEAALEARIQAGLR